MSMSKVDWKSNGDLAVGKGATVQEFMAIVGADKLAIDVAPWGEGRLRVNGQEIAHLKDAKDRRQAFRELKMIAEHYLQTKAAPFEKPGNSVKLPAVKARLLEGKKGLIVGIANDQSIAWGCAKAFRALGAELAVTYLNDKAKKYVEPLAQALEAPIVMPLDVRAAGQMEAVFEKIASVWGKLDFLVHSIAFSPKEALQGRVVDVSRDGFLTTLDVSCWTFIRMAHLAEPLMRKGGTLFTMTYYGSQMVVKNYNIMGVAKAALESAVRYIAAELGPKGIRVHAISPGPLATRAASGIPEFDALLDKAKAKAPAKSSGQHRRCRRRDSVSCPRRRAVDHWRNAVHRWRLSHYGLRTRTSAPTTCCHWLRVSELMVAMPIKSPPHWLAAQSPITRRIRPARVSRPTGRADG